MNDLNIKFLNYLVCLPVKLTETDRPRLTVIPVSVPSCPDLCAEVLSLR